MAALYDSTDLYENSSYTYDGYPLRTASGSGLGDSNAAQLVIHLKTASGSGTGTSASDELITRPRTATGTGGATAGDAANGLVTRLRSGASSGVGGSDSYGATAQLRTVATVVQPVVLGAVLIRLFEATFIFVLPLVVVQVRLMWPCGRTLANTWTGLFACVLCTGLVSDAEQTTQLKDKHGTI